MSCCLCRRPVMEASALVKHKRFHGELYKSAKKMINDLLMENFQLPVMAFKEMSNSQAYLCHKCHSQTSKCLKLQEEVRKIKDNFLSMASNLTPLPLGNDSVSRKRTASVRDSAAVSNAETFEDACEMSAGEPSTSTSSVTSNKTSPSVTVSQLSKHDIIQLMFVLNL